MTKLLDFNYFHFQDGTNAGSMDSGLGTPVLARDADTVSPSQSVEASPTFNEKVEEAPVKTNNTKNDSDKNITADTAATGEELNHEIATFSDLPDDQIKGCYPAWAFKKFE